MSKHSQRAGLVNPETLAPFDEDRSLITVIIETPKGSRNKYAFDAHELVKALKKVLPAGMALPYDFGFVPSTIGGDGDPLDVLVLMDEPAFAGCKLNCRLIGIIEGEQGDQKEKERNDRVVAIESDNHSFAQIKHLDDLGKPFLRELEDFFVNYHRLSGKEFRILAAKGPSAARKVINLSRRKAK